MRRYDVFNGDADGLCALHQWRLAHPAESTLVTGVKRDIALLERVPAQPGDEVSVLDISLDRNRAALIAQLDRGVQIRWFDHHGARDIPSHAGLEAHIDQSPQVCTSILVDRALGGLFTPWAIVAAYGDNLADVATQMARQRGLTAGEAETLRTLGENLNYNAYGETEADLLIPPRDLYRMLAPYRDPFAVALDIPAIAEMGRERAADMQRATTLAPYRSGPSIAVYLLPDAAWSRRVGGTFANRLANEMPDRAHAVLIPDRQGHLTVSVRSPKKSRVSALEVCQTFPGGGGRAGAAGIDHLPPSSLPEFLELFERRFTQTD